MGESSHQKQEGTNMRQKVFLENMVFYIPVEPNEYGKHIALTFLKTNTTF